MNDSPNYEGYSLQQLSDVAQHINREKYPERYAVVVQEIARKEQALAARPPLKNSPVSLAAAMTGCFLGGTLGLVVGAGLGYGALMLMIATGPSSAKANLDGATGMGGIIILLAFIGGAMGAIKGTHHALKSG